MKKTVAFLLACVCLLALVACNNAESETTDAAETTTEKVDPATCAHKELEGGSCTQVPRCKRCHRPIGQALGHEWTGGACLRCGKSDPLKEKEEGVVRVVCVGDSITKGGYWQNRMQGFLPSEYEVIGLGVNGATGLVSGYDQGRPWAYVIHEEYEMSLRYQPDVVVIMLGTNDTKGPNYKQIKADGGAQYKADMIALIDSYKGLEAEPQIFLALPPTVYRERTAEGINDEALDEMLLDLLTEIAAETGVSLIDVHTATAGQGEKFPDGVHPNADGKTVIAQTVAEAILQSKVKEYGCEVGQYCYEMDRPLLNGERTAFSDVMNIRDVAGKITVLNFWYTNCPPCVAEMPTLIQIARDYSDDVAVIACHADMGNQSQAIAYINEHWGDTPILFGYDTRDEYYFLLGGPGFYPKTLILDADGVVVAMYQEALEYDVLQAHIEALLAE